MTSQSVPNQKTKLPMLRRFRGSTMALEFPNNQFPMDSRLNQQRP